MDHYILLQDVRILHEERVEAALRQARWEQAISARYGSQESLWSRALRWLGALTSRADASSRNQPSSRA